MKLKNFFDLLRVEGDAAGHYVNNRAVPQRQRFTNHFLDLSRGGGFLGMRKRALIGCMSHRAGGGRVDR